MNSVEDNVMHIGKASAAQAREEIKEQNTREFDPIAEMIQSARRRVVDTHDEYNGRLGITYTFNSLFSDIWDDLNDRAGKWLTYNGSLQRTVDGSKLIRLVIAEATKIGGIPAFANSEMVNAFGSPENAVRAVLLPGEIADYGDLIMKLSGFKNVIKDEGLVAAKVKNS